MKGNQKPTYTTVTGDVDTYVSDTLRAAGVELMPYQRDLVDAFAAAYERTVCVSLPRQNGKSYAARLWAIWLADVEGARVLYTAHHSRVAYDMAALTRRMVSPEVCPALAADVAEQRRAYGRESILFASGGEIIYQTRTNAAARGGTYDAVIIDEAQEYTTTQQAALSPVTMAAEHVPRVIMIGTPPEPSCPGDVFCAMRKRAKDGDKGVWWVEWGVDEIGDVSDRRRWARTNPALGHLVDEKAIAGRLSEMPPDMFAREILGWWKSDSAVKVESIVDASDWEACTVAKAPADGVAAAGIKYAPDARSLALCCCALKDGIAHVEYLRTAAASEGNGWLIEWIRTHRSKLSCILVDGVPATALKAACGELPRDYLRLATTKDMTRAAAELVNGIEAHIVTHIADDALTKAITTSWRRNIGRTGAYAFGGERALVCEAAALAIYAAQTTQRKAGKKSALL